MTANTTERVVQLQGVEVATPFVEHVAGNRRESWSLERIGGRSDRQQRQEADERHGVVFNRPDPEAVRQDTSADLGKPERRIGA
jgi:hypothetical protein